MISARWPNLVLLAMGLAACDRAAVSALSDDSDLDFVVGTRTPPPLVPSGPGAGEWNSEPPTWDNQILAATLPGFLRSPAARAQWGEEASATFAHYFDNDGADFVVDPQRLITDVPRLAGVFDAVATRVDLLAASLAPGTHPFASRVATVDGIARAENGNWYLAMAGFAHYVTGTIVVDDAGTATAVWDWHVWDRYDWDPGVVIPIDTPIGRIEIDQERVGEFHRQGLAKEFSTTGTLQRRRL